MRSLESRGRQWMDAPAPSQTILTQPFKVSNDNHDGPNQVVYTC